MARLLQGPAFPFLPCTLVFLFSVVGQVQGQTDISSHQSRQSTPQQSNPTRAPLLVQLLAPLDAGKLSTGSRVIAKARVDWSDAGCRLRAGSVVTGHVTEVTPKSNLAKGSAIAIVFDQADCDGHLSSVDLRLFAIVAAPELDEGRPLTDREGLLRSMKENSATGTGPLQVQREDVLVNRSHSSSVKVPTTFAAGQVVGLSKIMLSVGTGTGGASVLSSAKGNVRLDPATRLILIYHPAAKPALDVSATPPHAAAAAPALARSSPADSINHPVPTAPVEAAEVDETEICTASCTVLAAAEPSLEAKASLSLPLAGLGSIPHNHGSYGAFDFESTLTYLDSQNLLFTYDPHSLRQRTPNGIHGESMRTIRAVLLDPDTLAVKRVLDWLVQGESQYLWPTVEGGILVHMGHHLRLFGPGLEVRRDLLLAGQLVFVSQSPNGQHIAVGTTHERYTRDTYLELLSVLKREPEEDTDVQLFDGDFKLLLTTRQSSSQPSTVMSNAGELRVHSLGRGRWHIKEYSWDGAERTIATTRSDCHPDLVTLPSSLVFVIGCGGVPSKHWYRVMRLDGHTILKRLGSSQEIEQTSSSRNFTDFAVRVVRTHFANPPGKVFRKEGLQRGEIAVFRVSDAKRLLSIIASGVSLAEQSFSLSPSGRQLAVLSDTAIAVYKVDSVRP